MVYKPCAAAVCAKVSVSRCFPHVLISVPIRNRLASVGMTFLSRSLHTIPRLPLMALLYPYDYDPTHEISACSFGSDITPKATSTRADPHGLRYHHHRYP